MTSESVTDSLGSPLPMSLDLVAGPHLWLILSPKCTVSPSSCSFSVSLEAGQLERGWNPSPPSGQTQDSSDSGIIVLNSQADCLKYHEIGNPTEMQWPGGPQSPRSPGSLRGLPLTFLNLTVRWFRAFTLLSLCVSVPSVTSGLISHQGSQFLFPPARHPFPAFLLV